MLKSILTLSDKNRISSIDIFRAIAIIVVVLFHYNHLLPYGYIGVDLFFVISGLLVSAVLVKDFREEKRINFPRFILQRGFKIWPSYFTFVLLGNLIAYTFFRSFGPNEYIEWWDLKRYLLFYQNYTGAPYHLTFDGVWSLCVEEHFYILLPLGFILLQVFRGNKTMLFASVILVIILGFAFKLCSFYLTQSKDTSSGTHNRIDALAWGVLLHLLLVYYPNLLKKGRSIWLLVVGLFLLAAALIIDINTSSTVYHRVLFHSLTPIAFFFMIAGVYHYDFSRLKVLRFVAYYSYNWYLWHPLLRPPMEHFTNFSMVGFFIYLIFGFLLAMFFTIAIEEPVLNRRKKILDRFFKKQPNTPLVVANET